MINNRQLLARTDNSRKVPNFLTGNAILVSINIENLCLCARVYEWDKTSLPEAIYNI